MSKEKSKYEEFMKQIYAYRARKGKEIYESLKREFSKSKTYKTH